jgi:stage III sporulation protein AB
VEILINLKNSICSLGIPLYTAFENIGAEETGGVWSEIFLRCSQIMNEQRMDAGSAWRMAISENRGSIPLESSDWDSINDFGELLGKSDRYNQESILDMVRDNIALLERKAEEAMRTKGKLYRNLGALSGAAVVILLI